MRVHQFAFDIGTGHRGGGLGGTQCEQLVDEQVFQAFAAGNEEFQKDNLDKVESSSLRTQGSIFILYLRRTKAAKIKMDDQPFGC